MVTRNAFLSDRETAPPEGPAGTSPGVEAAGSLRREGGLGCSGWARLAVSLLILLCVVYFIAPILPARFAPMRDFAAVVDETGITPGALFYTDVPQSSAAELHNRDALRYGGRAPARPDE